MQYFWIGSILLPRVIIERYRLGVRALCRLEHGRLAQLTTLEISSAGRTAIVIAAPIALAPRASGTTSAVVVIAAPAEGNRSRALVARLAVAS